MTLLLAYFNARFNRNTQEMVLNLKLLVETNRKSSSACNVEAQEIRSRIVSHNVKVLLSLGPISDVNLSVDDALRARIKRLRELRSIRTVDHSEASTGSLAPGSRTHLGQLSVRLALLTQNLSAGHDEACTLHRHDLRELVACTSRDVVGPGLALRGLPDEGPACDVDVDVLGILVVSKKGLGMLPAVQASDLAELRVDNALEGVGLAVTPVGPLHVGGLDLATVVDNGASGVDKRL